MASTISAGTTSGTAIAISGDTSGSLVLQTNGTTTAVTIDTSQNVGIGTSTPSTYGKLAVSDGTIVFSVSPYSAGSTLYSGVATNHAYAFLQNNLERMRIDSSGNLVVGATSSSGKLSSTSTSITQSPISANSPASFTTGNYSSNSLTAAGTGWFHFYGVSSNNTVQNVIIYGNGNIQNANNSYGALSDIKIKENIIDATPKLADLCKVQIRTFNLKNDPEVKQIGVIAQELEAIFPSMIDETLDRDAEGNGIGTTTKSVKYSVFVPMLIKAIQELKAIIDAQAASITALEVKDACLAVKDKYPKEMV